MTPNTHEFKNLQQIIEDCLKHYARLAARASTTKDMVYWRDHVQRLIDKHAKTEKEKKLYWNAYQTFKDAYDKEVTTETAKKWRRDG